MASPHHPLLSNSNTYKPSMIVFNLDCNVSLLVTASLHGLLRYSYWDGGIETGKKDEREAFIVSFYSIVKTAGPKLASKESCFVSCLFANGPCCLVSVFLRLL